VPRWQIRNGKQHLQNLINHVLKNKMNNISCNGTLSFFNYG
jgi:hypothetical protein